MWSEYRAFGHLLYPSFMVCQDVQPVCINYQGNVCMPHLFDEGKGRGLFGTDAWTYGYGIVGFR